MKKKILFINPSLRQGGVEHSLITVLQTLDPEQYEISLFLYTDMTDLLPQIPDHVRVIVQPDRTKYFRKPYSVLKLLQYRICGLLGARNKAEAARQAMYAYIHRQKVAYPAKNVFRGDEFDAVISYSLHIGTEMSLLLRSRRYYVLMHSSDPKYHREIIERSLMRFDKIIAVSNGVADVYRENYPCLSEKITSIENYVDAARTLRLAQDAISSDMTAGAEWVFTTCGRLSHEKGFDLAVETAGKLKEKGLSFRWLFIGDGAEREPLEKLIREQRLENEILITGFQENPFPYMNACAIYVQPSYEEAQPLVLLEAMILGKPIVSTNTVGGRTILENGKKGVLTDFSAESLADGILSLINAPEKRAAFSNLYTSEDDRRNWAVYAKKWNALLSE